MEQAKKYLVLLVLNRVVTDVESDQVLILLLSQCTGKYTECVGRNLAVSDFQALNRIVLIDHYTELPYRLLRPHITVAEVEYLERWKGTESVERALEAVHSAETYLAEVAERSGVTTAEHQPPAAGEVVLGHAR